VSRKFDAFLKEVKNGVIAVAKGEAKEFAKQAGADGRKFADAIRADLDKWARQLAAGELSKSDFNFLVRGKKDLAEMDALTQAGLAAVRIERIRTASIALIVKAASKLV
jgi:hypothetical protein